MFHPLSLDFFLARSAYMDGAKFRSQSLGN